MHPSPIGHWSRKPYDPAVDGIDSLANRRARQGLAVCGAALPAPDAGMAAALDLSSSDPGSSAAILDSWIAEFVSRGPASLPPSVCSVLRAGAMRVKEARGLVA